MTQRDALDGCADAMKCGCTGRGMRCGADEMAEGARRVRVGARHELGACFVRCNTAGARTAGGRAVFGRLKGLAHARHKRARRRKHVQYEQCSGNGVTN